MYKLLSTHSLPFYLYSKVESIKVRYDAWYVVLVAVLLALAATVYLGLVVWCNVTGHGGFVGEFRWVKWGVKVSGHCRY